MLISVVIPLYNKRETVARAIASVLVQTHAEFELIVVDDGSTDGSDAVVRGLSGQDRLRYERQENQGVSAARNRGLQLARADHVAFLDADDVWHPEFLAEIAGLVREHPSAALFACASCFVAAGVAQHEPGSVHPGIPRGVVQDFYAVYAAQRGVVNSSSACVRKGALQAIGGFPVGRGTGEDIYVWLRLAAAGEVVLSNRRLATVYTDREGRALRRLESEFPYHLHYFLRAQGLAEVAATRRRSATRFLMKSAAAHAAGAVLAGNRGFALRCARAALPHTAMWSAAFVALALSPAAMLRPVIDLVRRRA